MKNIQSTLFDFEMNYPSDNALINIKKLIGMHKAGLLGGEVMPEDARPSAIIEASRENFLFLTLPMALNYQRNSYKLWEAAAKTYEDEETRVVFFPEKVSNLTDKQLLDFLSRYKVALQPNKHIEIWRKISKVLHSKFEDDVEQIFKGCENDVIKIKELIQVSNKRDFPYLSGHKIFNYWLYVIESYTPIRFKNRIEITIAPDTHIIQSSIRLGIVNGEFDEFSKNRLIVSETWKELLKHSNIAPIDVHTPLWLWSRKGFPLIE